MKTLTTAFALALAGCAFAGTGPASTIASATSPQTASISAQQLAPVQRPAPSDLRSFTATSLVDGSRNTFQIEPSGYGIRARQANGCIWTRAADWFSPSDSWANCGSSRNWHTAQAQVREIQSIYPLSVGSVGRYERNATSHSGRTQSRQTVCQVTGTETVSRPGLADTPAYVVQCDDTRRVRTTWYAPGEGPIAFTQVSHERGLEESWIRTN